MGQTRDLAKAAERVEAQRARILDAARRCFSERGFHGATIAAIAETAGISQGLIYRYFESKARIIHAITEGQREVRSRTLGSIRRCGDLVDLLLDKIEGWRAGARGEGTFDAAMFLEIAAEASRDPDIAAVVAAHEREVWADFAMLVKRSAEAAGRPLDDAMLEQRTVQVRCLIDGLVLCSTRDPALDRATARAALLGALADLGL